MKYLLLFLEYFKTGLFSVGGGLATLPFLTKMGEKYGWFTEVELANMLAVSESTPGPIGVNMATYAGNTVGGVLGGFLATFALVLPSYFVILLVYKVMNRFRDNLYVQGSMKILRPASVGMVAAAVGFTVETNGLGSVNDFVCAFVGFLYQISKAPSNCHTWYWRICRNRFPYVRCSRAHFRN